MKKIAAHFSGSARHDDRFRWNLRAL